MVVSLIVAMDEDQGIGKHNDLMWHLPDDMKFFKETTKGHIVVMGRKNFESIPEKYRPLPGRENVVLTRNSDYEAIGCTVFHSFEDCMKAFQNEEEKIVFIIGGGEIYRMALEANAVDEMYITHVDKSYGADTFFPEYKTDDWKIETVLEHEQDERHEAAFSVRKYSKK